MTFDVTLVAIGLIIVGIGIWLSVTEGPSLNLLAKISP
jgi:hypothetical protein